MKEFLLADLLKEAPGWDVLKTLEKVENAVRQNHGEGVILFRNEAFDSSQIGAASFVVFGPDCTYKTPEEADGKWLNDLPSQRQYPIGWAKVLV